MKPLIISQRMEKEKKEKLSAEDYERKVSDLEKAFAADKEKPDVIQQIIVQLIEFVPREVKSEQLKVLFIHTGKIRKVIRRHAHEAQRRCDESSHQGT